MTFSFRLFVTLMKGKDRRRMNRLGEGFCYEVNKIRKKIKVKGFAFSSSCFCCWSWARLLYFVCNFKMKENCRFNAIMVRPQQTKWRTEKENLIEFILYNLFSLYSTVYYLENI